MIVQEIVFTTNFMKASVSGIAGEENFLWESGSKRVRE